LTETDVVQLIKRRFCSPAWVVLSQIRSGTGRFYSRTADAIAMSVYPSRGLELHGFEIKTSRMDWKLELENPEKAEAVFKYCDRWWLVVSDPKIVQTGELPPTWGLLYPRGHGLYASRAAPKLKAKAIDRAFMASILRKVQGEVGISAEEVNVQVREAREAGRSQAAAEVLQLRGRLEDLQKMIRSFEQASGLRLDSWSAGRIGEVVSFIQKGGLASLRQDLLSIQRQVNLVHTTVSQALEMEQLSSANVLGRDNTETPSGVV